MTHATDSAPRPPAIPGATVPGPYRQLVWDWNGTLLDDVQASVNAINRLLKARRLPLTDAAHYRASFGFPVRDYYLALGFQLDHEDWDLLARTYHDYFLADPSIRVRPAARRILQHCQAAGFGLSLLSAAEQSILDRMLSAAELTPFFAFVHGVDNLYGHSKAAMGKRLLQRLACPPAQILFVGDTLHDHEVATALGCGCVLIAEGHQTRARLQTAGCPVLNRLVDVPAFLARGATPPRSRTQSTTAHRRSSRAPHPRTSQ